MDTGKWEIGLTWHRRAENVPSYIDLRPVLCYLFSDSKNFVDNLLIHIIFNAVGADLSWDIFYGKGPSITIKGNGRCALFSIPMFADDALS